MSLPHEIRQASLPPRTFQLEHLDTFEEKIITFKLTSAFNVEDEVIANAAQLDLALEFLVSQALSADGVLEGITNHGFHLACTTLVFTSFLRGFPRGNGLELNNSLGEAFGELFGVFTDDRAKDLDIWHEAVCSGSHGRELGVIGSDPFDAVQLHIDLLSWT